MMDPQYVYTKKRAEFGRQCSFADEASKLMENIVPNKRLRNDYTFKNPVSRSTQCSNVLAEHQVI
jgi:dynein intermediate chain 2